jgi:hypothetical protein
LEQPVEKPEPKLEPKPEPKPRKKTAVYSGAHITKDWQPSKPVGRPLAFSSNMLDIFARARDEIASGKARGKIRDSGKNTKRKP